MADDRMPYQIIKELAAARSSCSDAALLAELAALPPLADEDDPCWDDDHYWREVAYLYLALADLAAARRLIAAIPLLLARACYGDPGEIMRGLRHTLEAAIAPNWSELADICMEAARSPRLGTRYWAIDELAVLEDPRSQSLIEEALRDGPDPIREVAELALERLSNAQRA